MVYYHKIPVLVGPFWDGFPNYVFYLVIDTLQKLSRIFRIFFNFAKPLTFLQTLTVTNDLFLWLKPFLFLWLKPFFISVTQAFFISVTNAFFISVTNAFLFLWIVPFYFCE